MLATIKKGKRGKMYYIRIILQAAMVAKVHCHNNLLM